MATKKTQKTTAPKKAQNEKTNNLAPHMEEGVNEYHDNQPGSKSK